MAVFWQGLQDVVDVLQRHRIEGERERRGAPRRVGEERIVVGVEVVARLLSALVGVPKAKDMAVTQLFHYVVRELEAYRETAEVGGGYEQIEFLDVRRASLLGTRIILFLHAIEGIEQFAIHALAVEQ